MSEIHDLAGVGIGPFNLSLAALADGVPDARAVFLEARPEFSWHPGMLLPDARLQVPFLADLVTLVDPTSRWSFLNYLREHERLFPFYFTERWHVPRREYDHYCRWVSRGLGSCRFGSPVTALRWDGTAFALTAGDTTVRARNVVLGVGTEPVLPPPLAGLTGAVHSADYLWHRQRLLTAGDVTVVGSGQSGAEIVLDLLRSGRPVRWLTKAPAFAPMEYSKLGLEHFTPDYTAYFRGLSEPTRNDLVPAQWQLYKAISAETIADIYDVLYESGIGGGWPDVTLQPNVEVIAARAEGRRLLLRCRQLEQDVEFDVATDAVVSATGYAPRRPALLDPLAEHVDWDGTGRYRVDADYRVATDLPGGLFVQNAEAHTHGVGAPDLGLGAHRAAVILNAITGGKAYPLPGRSSFTTFGAADV